MGGDDVRPIRWSLTTETAAANPPATTATAKSHLRIGHSNDDTLIDRAVLDATQWVENETGRALITQTLKLWLDRFPPGRNEIPLPYPPVQSVTSVKYIDPDGTEQTLSSANYIVTAGGSTVRIVPIVGQAWPSTQDRPEAVYVEYVAGYGDDPGDVPATLINALLLMVAEFYTGREAELSVAHQGHIVSAARLRLANYCVRYPWAAMGEVIRG